MSGQQEQWDGLDQVDQLDPREATLDFSRLIERTQSHLGYRADETEHGIPRSAGSGGGGTALFDELMRAAGDAPPLFRTTVADRSGSTTAPPLTAAAREITVPPASPAPAADTSPPATTATPVPGSTPVNGFEPATAADFSHVEDVAPETVVPAVAADPVGEIEPEPAGLDEQDDVSAASAEADAGSTEADAAHAGPPEAPLPSGPAQAAARPEPGSRADLKLRLERLPLGHPSSPYHVDGERKSPPPRLKHLELAPPARDWLGEIRGGGSIIAAQSPAAGGDQPAPDYPAPDHSAPDHSAPDDAAPDQAAEHPVPDPQPASHHVASHQVASHQVASHQVTDDVAVDRPVAGRRAADDGVNDGTAVFASIGTSEPPGRSVASDEALPRRNASTVGFGPAPASRMKADGSWAWGSARLTQEQVRRADEIHDRFRAAEGRSIFGGYSDEGLTPMMRRVEQGLEHGRLAPDTDKRALLEPDAFKARFADMLRRFPDRPADHLARRVPGALSYSLIFDNYHYSEGTWLAQEALEARGYQMQARKNAWSSAENRCVLTMWRDPASDLPFEVQFHTAASLEAQHLARTSAALINDPRIPATEAAGLRTDLATAWAALPAPPGNDQIGDYRRATRSSQQGQL